MRSVIVLLVLLAAVPASGYIQPKPSVGDFMQMRVFWECYYREEAHLVYGFARRSVRVSLGYDSEASFLKGMALDMSRDLRLLNVKVRNETPANFRTCLAAYTTILCPKFFGVYLSMDQDAIAANCE